MCALSSSLQAALVRFSLFLDAFINENHYNSRWRLDKIRQSSSRFAEDINPPNTNGNRDEDDSIPERERTR